MKAAYSKFFLTTSARSVLVSGFPCHDASRDSAQIALNRFTSHSAVLYKRNYISGLAAPDLDNKHPVWCQ
jgi:hypothetical protein